jgi:hypothetical protein
MGDTQLAFAPVDRVADEIVCGRERFHLSVRRSTSASTAALRSAHPDFSSKAIIGQWPAFRKTPIYASYYSKWLLPRAVYLGSKEGRQSLWRSWKVLKMTFQCPHLHPSQSISCCLLLPLHFLSHCLLVCNFTCVTLSRQFRFLTTHPLVTVTQHEALEVSINPVLLSMSMTLVSNYPGAIERAKKRAQELITIIIMA